MCQLYCIICLFFSALITGCSIQSVKTTSAFNSSKTDGNPQTIVDYHTIGTIKNNKIVITQDVDLKGGVCHLPPRYVLEFSQGVLRNGTLVGNNNKIKSKYAVFDHIDIKGDWYVKTISTDLFVDLSYSNALKNVFALASPNKDNVILIKEGSYYVETLSEWDRCLKVCSNTELIIDGVISIKPNSNKAYDILFVSGENIRIKGDGTIIGDKLTHIGGEGEWGMGINMYSAKDISVSGITIKDCWGDCIYIGNNSKKVLVENCHLSNGRRQGISVTSAVGVTIKNCTIENVNGTEPAFGIDIEPNKNENVDNVIIENVNISNCTGGIMSYGRAPGARVGNIMICGCDVAVSKYSTKLPIDMDACERLLVKKNKLHKNVKGRIFICRNINNCDLKDNFLFGNGGLLSKFGDVYTIKKCKSFHSVRNREIAN